ncbi:hypothetical protein COLO4_04068 [Corchorus olitorius]|uniref:Uncharacterized protein n=1 Tax=Corchorus olitorius TaxID=93759 RepID=A0A1R3KVC2_9ROSI|nr:hypothetical protein COLO4_04068 [Corchorus olitorius]
MYESCLSVRASARVNPLSLRADQDPLFGVRKVPKIRSCIRYERRHQYETADIDGCKSVSFQNCSARHPRSWCAFLGQNVNLDWISFAKESAVSFSGSKSIAYTTCESIAAVKEGFKRFAVLCSK